MQFTTVRNAIRLIRNRLNLKPDIIMVAAAYHMQGFGRCTCRMSFKIILVVHGYHYRKGFVTIVAYMQGNISKTSTFCI